MSVLYRFHFTYQEFPICRIKEDLNFPTYTYFKVNLMKVVQSKFHENKTSSLAPSFEPALFVGNVVPKDFLISPIGKEMTVHYNITCCELIKKKSFFGSTEFWEQKFSESKSVNFFISDPDVPSTILCVPAADASVAFQSSFTNEIHIGGGLINYDEDIANNRIFSNSRALLFKSNQIVSSMQKLPVELVQMAKRNSCPLELVKGLYRRLKFVETVISVGSDIGVVGILTDLHNDPSILLPVENTSVDHEYFVTHGWSVTEERQWNDTVRTPVYLCYDHREDKKAERIRVSSLISASLENFL